MKPKNVQSIINESLFDEVKKTILRENKESSEIYHITCEGEPVETFENKEMAMRHLDIYKKKHPEKEFIIEKKKYNSPSDMIDKLDEMGEKLELKENKPMGTKKEVKNFAHAVMDAKERGLKEFKINGETHDVNESWKQLEEEEFGDGRDEIDMDKDGKITGKDFKMLRNKKKGKCDECSQKMEESEDDEDFENDGEDVHSIWEKYNESALREFEPSEFSDEFDFADNVISHVVQDAIENGDIDEKDEEELMNDLKDTYGYDLFDMFRNGDEKGFDDDDSDEEYDDDEEDMNENKSMCSECGGMLNEEGSCNECSGGMYESNKRTLRLTESELVSLISRMVESVPGVDVTKRAQKGSKKENDDYMKEVGKKLKKSASFDGADNPKFPKQNGKGEKMAINATPEQDEYTATHRGGTLADLDYDQEPSENFKKRLKMALEGDTKMGNSQDAANVIKTDTGKNIGKTSEKKKGIEKKAKEVSWGHSWKSPEEVVIVKESKNRMSSILEEEIKRMKKMYKYDEKTQ